MPSTWTCITLAVTCQNTWHCFSARPLNWPDSTGIRVTQPHGASTSVENASLPRSRRRRRLRFATSPGSATLGALVKHGAHAPRPTADSLQQIHHCSRNCLRLRRARRGTRHVDRYVGTCSWCCLSAMSSSVSAKREAMACIASSRPKKASTMSGSKCSPRPCAIVAAATAWGSAGL